MGNQVTCGKESKLSYRILDTNGLIIQMGWFQNGIIRSESRWNTVEEVEEALYLLTHRVVG